MAALLISGNMKLFEMVKKPPFSPSGWLLIPYLVWVTFAGYLNLGIWLLN